MKTNRALPLLVTSLALGLTAAGCGPRDKSRSSWSATAGITSATSGSALTGVSFAGAPDLRVFAAGLAAGAQTGAQTGAQAGTVPAGGGSTTGGSTAGTAGNVGSPYWYEGDTFGNPLKTHSGAEEALAAGVLAGMNAERQAAGLAPLVAAGDCVRAAKAHTEDMEGRGFFDHITPEGWTPDDRLRWTGAAPYSAGGENIAAGQAQASAIVAAWMASPAHRANVLSSLFTHVGVGISAGSPTYACAVFVTR